MFIQSLPSSTASQVVASKISQSDVGLKLGFSDVMAEGEKYGYGLGTRLFDLKEDNILFS